MKKKEIIWLLFYMKDKGVLFVSVLFVCLFFTRLSKTRFDTELAITDEMSEKE